MSATKEVKPPSQAETIAASLIDARIDMNVDSAVGVALAKCAKGDPDMTAKVEELRPKIAAAILGQFVLDKLTDLIESVLSGKKK